MDEYQQKDCQPVQLIILYSNREIETEITHLEKPKKERRDALIRHYRLFVEESNNII